MPSSLITVDGTVQAYSSDYIGLSNGGSGGIFRVEDRPGSHSSRFAGYP